MTIPRTPASFPRPWLMLALLWVVACSNYLARTMTTTMHGSLVAAIPMTEAQFGLITSAFLWAYGAASPFAGFLADRFSRSRVIVAALLVWSAMTCLAAYATTFPQLLVMRMLMGLSEACYLPAGLALVADYHRGPTRSLATGLHMTGFVAGAILGGLGGWLAERHTWSYAFSAVGLPSLIYGLLLVWVLRDAPREGGDTVAQRTGARFGPALASLFGRGSFTLALACVVLFGGVGWIVVGWLPTYVGERFQFGQGAAGFFATGYVNVASVLGMIVGGVWSDRWSRTNVRSRMLVPAIGGCLAAPAMLVAARTSVVATAIAGLLLYGFTRSFFDANQMPILCLVSDPRYRATGYGLMNAASCLTGGVVIYVTGALRDRQIDLGAILSCAAAGLLVCAFLLVFIGVADREPGGTASPPLPHDL